MYKESCRDFCFIYWNIWTEAQLDEQRWVKLKERFKELLTTYQPDVLGISEVLRHRHITAPLLDFLEELGYHTYYTHFYLSPNGLLEFGIAIATRVPPLEINEYKLSPYKLSRYLSVATIALTPNKKLRVAVVHPLPIVARDLREHVRQIRTLRKHLIEEQVDILGGDLNEFSWVTNLWQRKLPFNRLTGNLLKPTWILGGRGYMPIRFNLDCILWSKHKSIQLNEFKILDRQPSDHAPLLSRFTIY